MPSEDSGQTLDDIWSSEDPIFSRKELLDIDHIPSEDRIIGRDDEIEQVATSIHPAIEGGSPRNLLIYGKTGTGKSLVAKHVTQSAQEFAQNNDTKMGRVYVDCTQSTTETQVVTTLARALNVPDRTGLSVPLTGLSTDAYYNRLWQILDSLYDVVIIILDEIDTLQSNDLLMILSRAGESGKISDSKLGLIAISNKISYKQSLGERVLSSLQDRELIFPPYDADQLRAIMQNRSDAFHDDVLEDDVIPLSAAFAAREHGDARKALDILRNAGELAKDAGVERVTEQHVRDAREQADIDRFSQLLDGQPVQAKCAVFALSTLVKTGEKDEFTTREIYEVYEQVTSTVGADTLSQRRMSDKLSEQTFLDILGRSERVGRGRGRGMSHTYHLLEDPDVVQTVILQDDSFAALEGESVGD